MQFKWSTCDNLDLKEDKFSWDSANSYMYIPSTLEKCGASETKNNKYFTEK